MPSNDFHAQSTSPDSRALSAGALIVPGLLLACCLLFILALPPLPWCLDNGLRTAVLENPPGADFLRLDHAFPAEEAPALGRRDFPVVEPWAHWEDLLPRLVFPPLLNALARPLARLGGALGLDLFKTLAAALLLLALLRFLRAGEPPAGANDRRSIIPFSIPLRTALVFLACPTLFYVGAFWEVVPLAALVLWLLTERRRPTPVWGQPLLGLAAWLRPEGLLFVLGGLWMLKGRRRRLGALGGLLAGWLLNRWWTGSWGLPHVAENFRVHDLQPLKNLGEFLLPLADPGAAAGVAALSIVLVLLLLFEGRRLSIVRAGTALLLALVLALFWSRVFAAQDQLLPCWGLLAVCPLLLLSHAALRDRTRRPEALYLVALILALALLAPVATGFHWGPRLLAPFLPPLAAWSLDWTGAGFFTRRKDGGGNGGEGNPAAVSSAAASSILLGVLLVFSLAPQLGSLVLLQQRKALAAEQQTELISLAASPILTDQISLAGDFPDLARERRIFLPLGEGPLENLLESFVQAGRERASIVCADEQPMAVYFDKVYPGQLQFRGRTAGNRLGRPLLVYELDLAGMRPRGGGEQRVVLPLSVDVEETGGGAAGE